MGWAMRIGGDSPPGAAEETKRGRFYIGTNLESKHATAPHCRRAYAQSRRIKSLIERNFPDQKRAVVEHVN